MQTAAMGQIPRSTERILVNQNFQCCLAITGWHLLTMALASSNLLNFY